MTTESCSGFGIWATLLIGGSLVSGLQGAESYLAVFEADPSGNNGSSGYAALTLSEYSDWLCYTIALSAPPGDTGVVRFWRPTVRDPLRPALVAEAERPVEASGIVSGCTGPLSPDDQRELRAGNLRMEVSGATFSPEGLVAPVVPANPDLAVAGLSAPDWDLVATVLEMDERQWGIVQGLLRLDSAQWSNLRSHLASDQAALISPAGAVYAVPGNPEPPTPAFLLNTNDLRSELRQPTMSARRARNAVTSSVDQTKSVLQDIDLPRPEGLVPNLTAGQALAELDALMDEVREAIEKIEQRISELRQSPWAARVERGRDTFLDGLDRGIQLLQFLRDGFVDFRTNPHDNQPDCGPDSPCQRFREDLLQLVSDIGTMFRIAPQMAELDGDLLGDVNLLSRLIEVTPPAALFLLSKVDELFPGWQSIPRETVEILQELFPSSPSPADLASPRAAQRVIDRLREPRAEEEKCERFEQNPQRFYRLRLLVAFLETTLNILEKGVCPVDSVVGGRLEVGAGLTLKSTACRKILTFLDKVVDMGVLSFLTDYLRRCQYLFVRSQVAHEANLLECRRLPSLFLPVRHGGQLDKLRMLVEFRRSQVLGAPLDEGASIHFLEEADFQLRDDRFATVYDCLCKAYGELVEPQSFDQAGLCPSPPRFEQAAFRGRNDDGDEQTATWIDDPNETWEQGIGRTFRVRFLIREKQGQPHANYRARLQWSAPAIDETDWKDVKRNSKIVRAATCAALQDGANTTKQLGQGTFVTPNAGVDNGDGDAGGRDWDFAGLDEGEAEFCLEIPSSVTRELLGKDVLLRIRPFGGNEFRVRYLETARVRVALLPLPPR